MATERARRTKRRPWSKEDVRELRAHSRSKSPVKKIARSIKRTAEHSGKRHATLACRSAIDGDLEPAGLSPRSKVRSRNAFGATTAHSRRWHRPCDAKGDPSLGGSYADTGGFRHVRRFRL